MGKTKDIPNEWYKLYYSLSEEEKRNLWGEINKAMLQHMAKAKDVNIGEPIPFSIPKWKDLVKQISMFPWGR